jgi:hypothetical protein
MGNPTGGRAVAQAPVKQDQVAVVGEQKEHESLRGTVAVIVVIGLIFLVVWIGVFLLYVSRN